jgi:serine/threonine protein kinase
MAGLEGSRLGNYELIEHLGTGGMAEVYRARQLQAFDRDVAIKIIKRGLAGDPVFRERFLREAHASARLDHPHILPLIEVGQEGRGRKRLFLVMPYIRGGTLRDLLGRTAGPLPGELIEVLFPQLGKAVQYAHEQGLVHRDIKPSNILLQHERHVLLADFGIALDTEDVRLTSTGMGLGTPEYTAPEQARGLADRRSDVYGLGIVLFEMLTGRVPFTGRTSFEVLFQHTTAPVPALRSVYPALPAHLERLEGVIKRALAKEPDQRFQTVIAFSDAVRDVLTGQSHTLSVPGSSSALTMRPAVEAGQEQALLSPDQEMIESALAASANGEGEPGQIAARMSQSTPASWAPPRAFLPLPAEAPEWAEWGEDEQDGRESAPVESQEDMRGELPTIQATFPTRVQRLAGKYAQRRKADRRQNILLPIIALLGVLLLVGTAAVFAVGLLSGTGNSSLSANHPPLATHTPITPSARATNTPRSPTATPSPSPSPSPTTTSTPVAAPQLVVTPSSLTFSVSLAQCPLQHPTQSLSIQNSGGGTLNWQASVQNPAYLSIVPTSGSVNAGASVTMTVSLICPTTPVSTTDHIQMTSNGGTVDVPVTITVS